MLKGSYEVFGSWIAGNAVSGPDDGPALDQCPSAPVSKQSAMRRRLALVFVLALASCRGNAFAPAVGVPQQAQSGGVSDLAFEPPHWDPVGPVLVGGWSGKINAFAFDPADPKVLYVGGGWGNTPRESPSQMGIYKTTDGGSTWAPADNGLTNTDGTISSTVNGLWLDPANRSIVLASTEFGGTFRSTDAGASWKNVDRAEATRFALSGKTLYLATRRGVLESHDDGASWTVSLRLAQGATTVAVVPGAIYAGAASGEVYRLERGKWARAGRPGSGAIHDIAIDPFAHDIVYANVDDLRVWNQRLYGSSDGGATWLRIYCGCSVGAQAIAFSLIRPHRLFLGEDSGYFVHVKAYGDNPHPKIRYATQPFGTDTRYIVPVKGPYKDDDACYILQDQGLAYAPRCSSGRAARLSALPNTLAYSVAVGPGGSALVAPLQDNGAGSSTDSGQTWRYVHGSSEGGEAFVDPRDAQNCYFAHPDAGLYASFDGCKSFVHEKVSGIESLAFDPHTPLKLYAVTNADLARARLSVSTDGGVTWAAAPWRMRDPYQVVLDPHDEKRILVASGTATGTPHLYYTRDGGTTWQRASGLPQGIAPNAQIYFPTHRLYAAFDPRRSNAVLVADHDPNTDDVEIYRSLDGAQTFRLVSTLEQPATQRPWPNLAFPRSELPPPGADYYATRFYANRLAFNPSPPAGATPAVVATTRFGAYISFDLGSTWRRLDALAIAHHFIGAAWDSGYLYLSSFGEGVVRSRRPLQ